jgi:hypothetical protein
MKIFTYAFAAFLTLAIVAPTVASAQGRPPHHHHSNSHTHTHTTQR